MAKNRHTIKRNGCDYDVLDPSGKVVGVASDKKAALALADALDKKRPGETATEAMNRTFANRVCQ